MVKSISNNGQSNKWFDPYLKTSEITVKDGWMDELGFYVPSTVFQSFGDDGRVNMKDSVQ